MKDVKLNLVQKLFEIRKKLDYFKKDTKGNQGVSYVDPELVLGKARKYMDEFKVLLVPTITNDTMTKVPNPTQNQPEHHDFAICLGMKMIWVNVEDKTDILEVPWYATGSHRTDPSMAFGGALTYSERYFMLKFFQIPTGKDDPEYHKNKLADPDEFISETQIEDLREKLKVIGNSEESYCEYKKVDKLSEIPLTEYQQCLIDVKPMVK